MNARAGWKVEGMALGVVWWSESHGASRPTGRSTSVTRDAKTVVHESQLRDSRDNHEIWH